MASPPRPVALATDPPSVDTQSVDTQSVAFPSAEPGSDERSLPGPFAKMRSGDGELRILFLLASAAIGGGNQSLLTLWNEMRKEGVTPLAVSPKSGPMVKLCEEQGVACRVLDFHQPNLKHPIQTWGGYKRWRRLLKECQPALIHANDPLSARSIMLAARRSGLSVVCHVRFPPGREFISWAFRQLPKPEVFVFNSRSLHRDIGPDFARACPKSSQQVVYNGVDLETFQPEAKPLDARGRVGFIVGIIANLWPFKGHGDFIEMARLD